MVKALKISEILVTFHVSDISAMISGAEGENFFVYNYTEDEVPGILAKHLKWLYALNRERCSHMFYGGQRTCVKQTF